jgi:glycosyltransferase involved in cell wall biosynthesis
MKSYLQSTRKLAPEQFLVVNNWQDDENYNGLAAKKEEGKRKTFVYVGSINAHSNVELIIRSFLNAKLDDAELLVYGGGAYKEKCQALVASARADNVHFSYVERKEVPNTQARADVLVLALPKGNGTICLPSKLTSYMLSGRPVLASVDEDSTTAAYINQSGSGVVVGPDNLEALTSAFIRLSEMTSQQLEEMGRKSRAFALGNLTREVNLSRVVSSVEGILLRTN